MRSLVRCGVLALLLGPASACSGKVVVATLPGTSPAVRTADSFIHCVEGVNSQCVVPGQASGGWNAFYLLSWLAHGSPVSIVAALPGELAAHGDPRALERRLVAEVERYAIALRGADCVASGQEPLVGLVDTAAAEARTRLQALGLWQRGLDRVVPLLRDQAVRELAGGFLVRIDCAYDPFTLYLGTRELAGRHTVTGFTTLMPGVSQEPPPTIVQQRLESRALGLADAAAPIAPDVVHPWLPFPIEEF